MISAFPLTQILLISIIVTHALTASNTNTILTNKPKNAGTKTTPTPAAGDISIPRKSEQKKEKTKSLSTFNNKRVSFASILTDSSPVGVKIFAEVINYEDSAAAYTVHLTDCSDNIPVTNIELEPAIQVKLPHISNFTAKITHVFLIPPRRSQVFIIDVIFQNSTKKFEDKATCLVNVLNRLNGKLATKLIILSPGDSCVCSFNCACACRKEDGNLICNQISDQKVVSDWLKKLSSSDKSSKEKVNDGNKKKKPQPPSDSADGRSSSAEVTGEKVGWMASANEKLQSLRAIKSLDDVHLFQLSLLLIVIIVLIFLVLGTCKGLWGICWYAIGRCGLSHFYDKPRILDKYYERKYSKYSVIHDSEGYPLDPFTSKRTVKRLNPTIAFILNVIYFLCCPVFCFYGLRDRCFKNRDDENNTFGSASDKKEPPFNETRGRVLSKTMGSEKSLNNLRRQSSYENINNVRVALQSSSAEFKLDDTEEEEQQDEGMKSSDKLNQELTYTTGFAHIQSDQYNTLSLPTSSTILQKLRREPEEYPDPRLKGRNQAKTKDESNNNNCCRPGIPYGSWHRFPSIFNDEYNGDSLFDIQRSLATSSRRSYEHQRPEQNESSRLLTSKSENWRLN